MVFIVFNELLAISMHAFMMSLFSTNFAFEPLVLQSSGGLRVEVLPHGATINSIQFEGRELTLGHAHYSDYKKNNGYLGATIGRYANRIAKGQFQFGGRLICLDTAGDKHCLHGGQGFSHRCWQVLRQQADEVELFLHSPDGDSGFPGDVSVWQTITLADNELKISFRATTETSTLISLTNHCYFNLDGSADITNHLLQIHAEQFLPISADLIPTGERRKVEGSCFDFRQSSKIADKLSQHDPQLIPPGGFDHCFIFETPAEELRRMATLSSSLSNISLTVSSTMPGLQFYAGQALSAPFRPNQALCLEAQYWPDSPNQQHFPSALLVKDQIYQHQIVYAFSKLQAFTPS